MEFDTEANRTIYADWHIPLLDRLFGSVVDLHWDLYHLPHAHRLEHNGGEHQGPCTAWPSPPYRGPVWHLLSQQTGAKRFLEIGAGVGYTTALMADAGGENTHVDTIELDSTHAEITKAELARKGLLDRVHILQGDAREVVPTLKESYDVVFADSGVDSDIMPLLKRLTRQGGVPPQIKGLLSVPLLELLTEFRRPLGRSSDSTASAIKQTRDRYEQTVKTALESTWDQSGTVEGG